MSPETSRSPTAGQVYAALVALGAPTLIDPEHRPDGPHETDRPALLGALLAWVELVTLVEPAEAMLEVSASYQHALGVDGDGGMRLMLASMRRLALLRGTLESVFGLKEDPTARGAVHAAGATSGLLQLLIFTDAPAATMADPDGAALLRQLINDVRMGLQGGMRAFEDARRELAERGYRL